MSKLVERLTVTFQCRMHRRQLLDVKATLQSMRKMLSETLGDGISVEVAECDGDEWLVHGTDPLL